MPLELDDTSIVNLLIEATAARLALKLQTEQDDRARAGLVRPGRLQDDPTTKKINVLVHHGGEEWPDVLNTVSTTAGGRYVDSPFTIGGPVGGIFWRRRLRVEFQMFFPNDPSRTNARQRAQVVLGRAHHALNTWYVAHEVPTDTFGEHVYQLQVVKSYLDEGGGEGDFNWKGELWVEFLTEIEPTE